MDQPPRKGRKSSDSRSRGSESRLKRKTGKLPPTSCGRRTNEELWEAKADGRSVLDCGGRSAHLDQNYNRGRDRDRRGRVHGNAQLALVGIAVERMHVDYLSHGQQRQQSQANQGSRPKGPRPGSLFAAGMRHHCSQEIFPCLKDTQNWMRKPGLGLRSIGRGRPRPESQPLWRPFV